MKRRCLLWSVIFLTSAVFSSCTDEENSIDTSALLQIYGRQYELASGVIWKSNDNVTIPQVEYVFEDTYMNEETGEEVTDKVIGFTAGENPTVTGNFMLSLYETGLAYNPALKETKGKGACVCFHLASPDADKLVPGKYVYGKSKVKSTFLGYSSSMYDMSGEAESSAVITEGEVNIQAAGEIYTVTFNCKTSFGGVVSGAYTGKLDYCDVEKMVFASYENVKLSGLQEEVEVTEYYSYVGDGTFDEEYPSTELDYSYSPAFFSSRTGVTSLGNDGGKEKVDIALVYDKDNESVYFESPIKMRTFLGHDDEYNFPCHTVYMKAPETFTAADYEKVQETGFDFEVTEEKVELLVGDDFQPCYVFFKNGNGGKGVIRVKEFTPGGSVMDEFNSFYPWAWMTYTTSPALILDVKCPVEATNTSVR